MMPSWYYLGLVQQKQSRPLQAITSFKKVLSIDPTYTRAYIALITTLEKLNRYAEARRYFKHGIKVARNPSAIEKLKPKPGK